MPAVTRAYTTACVLTTAAVVRACGVSAGEAVAGRSGSPRGAARRCGGGARGLAGGSGRPAAGGSCSACLSQQLEFITPFQLYFNPDLIFRKFQVRPRPGAGAPLAPSQRGVGAAGWALGVRLPRVVGECREIPGGLRSHYSGVPGLAGAGSPTWCPLLSCHRCLDGDNFFQPFPAVHRLGVSFFSFTQNLSLPFP